MRRGGFNANLNIARFDSNNFNAQYYIKINSKLYYMTKEVRSGGLYTLY